MLGASTVLTAAVEAVTRTVEGYGVTAASIAERPVVDPVAGDSGARLGAEQFHAFVAAASEASGDAVFGLSLARQFAVFNYHLHFVMAACPDLESAFHAYEKYQAVIGGGLQLGFEHGATESTILFAVPEPPRAQWVPTDTMTGGVVLLARSLALQPRLRPVRIESRRPGGASIEQAYAELFGCPVRFGQPRNELVFHNATFTAPLPTSNAQMLKRTEAVLADYVASLHMQPVKRRLAQLLQSELRNGVPRKSAMARRLGLSSRSLARHLASEGTSYRVVLEEVRATVARRCLSEDGASVTEVAFVLGFSDSTAFSRAFRRWTGVAPSAYVQST